MDTLNELIYYCKEPEPVGALMLSGEWGCGKTYIIDHQLIDKLADTHIFIRISLFGIDSIEALNSAVKKEWVLNWLAGKNKSKINSKVAKAGKAIFGTATNVIPILKDIKESLVGTDVLDYLPITPEIEVIDEENKENKEGHSAKSVVLIFDDFERSQLDKVSILGCINEYCENLHFHTIVVANEAKIDTSKNTLAYTEIKEKIIARTVQHKPDYEAIISSIIDGKKWFDDDYSTFLKNNKAMVQSVFSLETVKNDEGEKIERPHNIRSLKCALQDFHRLYVELVKADFPDIDQYLYAFICFVMAAKSGLVKEDDSYGYLFTDALVQKIYPLCNSKKMFCAAKDWIFHGELNIEKLEYEIGVIVKQLRGVEPKDKLRTYSIIDLDEETIDSGFDGLLQDVYDGELSLAEYILFIENSYYIRDWNISIPSVIEWTKVYDGISKRFQKNIDARDDEHRVYSIIDESGKAKYTDDEWNAYELIRDFRASEVYIYEVNKQLFIDELSKSGKNAFITLYQKRFNAFDDEMVDATIKAYKQSPSTDRIVFSGFFYDMWKYCDHNSDEEKHKIRDGFEKLNGKLKELKNQYNNEGKNIAARQTDRFITYVETLLSKLDNGVTTVSAPKK